MRRNCLFHYYYFQSHLLHFRFGTWLKFMLHMPILTDIFPFFIADARRGRHHSNSLTKTEFQSIKVSKSFLEKQKQTPSKQTKAFECSCGRTYSHSDSLKQHQRYECGKAPTFKCNHCPHVTHQRSNLYSHIRRMHL